MEEQDPLKIQQLLAQQAAKESLSFQSLIQELGDVSQGAPPPEPVNADAADVPDGSLLDKGEDFFGEPGTIDGDLYVAPSPRKQKQFTDIELRVLTGSAVKKTPLWITALFMGGAACLFLLPIIFQSSLMVWQPIYSYFVMLLGGGAVFWAGYGMLHEETQQDSWRCLIGLLLGLAAFVVAFLMRAPLPPAAL